MRVPYLALFPMLAALLPAQRISQGPYVGSPHILSVDDQTYQTNGQTLMESEKLLYKPAGINGFNPWLPFAVQGMPNIGQLLGFGNIDAVSGGLDWIQANSVGELQSPPQGVGTLTYSVTRATAGVDPVITAEVAAADGAAGDLFSLILPGSTLAPSGWVDRVMRAQDSTEINLAATNRKADLSAHDLFLMIFQAAPTLAQQLLPEFTGVYFSVDKAPASLARVPAAWWNGTLPSGATILWAPWDHTNGVFKTPEPFLTYTQLNLARTDDVDAFAYDEEQGYILFSTDRTDRDPLLFGRLTGGSVAVSIYRMPGSGTPISRKMGVSAGGPDDIDAVCALDPFRNLAARSGGFVTMSGVLGVPLPLGLPFPGTGLTATAMRMWDGPSNQPEFLVSCFTGWPRGGPPTAGVAAALVTTADYSIVISLGTFTRDPQSRSGDPRQVMVQMPNLPPNSVRLGLHWAVLSGSFFDLAPPAWIDW